MNDALPLKFDPSGLVLLNAIIALMMFGVSLDLRVDDFRRVLARPVGPAAGLLAQALLTPAATCLFTIVFRVDPALSLGMMLVAACPSGALSNILTWRARGTVALSVSMTAISSLAATVLTPFNFAFYGWLNPRTRELLQTISIPTGGILAQVALVLALPLMLGMLVGHKLPRVAAASERPLRVVSLLVLLAFVAYTFWARVYIGDHWLSDVVGGLALGIATGCAAIAWIVRCRATVDPGSDRAARRSVT